MTSTTLEAAEAELRARIILAYRNYQVEVNGVEPDTFGPGFDARVRRALCGRHRQVLSSGYLDVVNTARAVRGCSEEPAFFDFMKKALGDDFGTFTARL